MVAIPQVQMPDFAGTLMRGEAFQQSRLQALAQQQALQDAQNEMAAIRAEAPNLVGGTGPAYEGALARIMGAGPRGLQIALPLAQQQRVRREAEAFDWGGAGARVPAPAAGAPGDPLTRIAAVESGGDDNARNPRSSAAGRFQIIDSTWRQYAPRLGLTDAQRMDPAAQEAVARAIQADAQQAIGRPLSPGEQYGAHFLGIGGLRAFLSADPNADAQTVYAQAAGPQIAAQAFRNNPGLLSPGMTVGQVMQALGGRMGGGAPSGDTIPAQAAMPGGAPASRSGVDPAELRRIEAALASGNPILVERARARLQMLQFQMRDAPRESEPLESVLDPATGQPVLVPRSQAAGRQPVRTPPVQVQLPSGDNARVRADTATLTEVNQGANQARTILSMLDRAEQAVRRVPEGAGAQLVPILGQIGAAFGIQVQGTSEAEVLRSITTQLGVLQRVPGSGATTDFEMRLYMQAVPRLGTTREGNLQLIQLGRRLAERKLEEARIWRRHAGDPDLDDRLNALPPVFSPDERRILGDDATPASDPGTASPGPGGRGTAEPPPAAAPRGQPPAMPRVGEVRDGWRFRGGNPADRNSWEQVR
jgi:hypothetical protein